MNRLLIACLACILLPTSQAAILDDASGDVRIRVAGQETDFAHPNGLADLTALSIQDNETIVEFTLQIQIAESPTVARYSIEFENQGALYRIRGDASEQESRSAELQQFDDSSWSFVKNIQHERVPEGITVQVPKSLIPNGAGYPLLSGQSLTQFMAYAGNTLYNLAVVGGAPPVGTVIAEYDQMPDGGQPTGEYEIQTSGMPSRFLAPDPIRFSNGEAATYIFESLLSNPTPEPVLYELQVSDVPDNWEYHAPATTLSVPAKSTIELPITVSIPFRHEHGLTETMKITATTGELESTISVGVHFLDTPQPSGHHPDIWLHSFLENPAPIPGVNDEWHQYFTTAPTDESSEGTPSGFQDSDGFLHRACSFLPGGLKIGLDFDSSRVGILNASLEGPAIVEGTGRVSLVVFEPYSNHAGNAICKQNGRIHEELAGSEWVPFASDGALQEFSLVPKVDRLPAAPGRNLAVIVDWTSDSPLAPQAGFKLSAGANGFLPLNEFSDAEFQTFSDTHLMDEPHKERSPGTVAVFQLNPDYAYEFIGSYLEWASLDGGQFIVSVPDDAVIGTLAEFAIQYSEPTFGAFEVSVRVVEPGSGSDTVIQEEQDASATGFLASIFVFLLIGCVRTKSRQPSK